MSNNLFSSISQKFAKSWLGSWWSNVDRLTILLVLSLFSIGLVLTFGSSGPAVERLSYNSPFYFVYRQVVFAAIAVTILFSLSFLSINQVRRISLLIYISAFALLVVILVFGHSAKGAQRWLKLGAFSLQPSELIKPAAIVLISWVLTRRFYDINFKGEIIALIIVATPISIFLLQPDIGQTLLLSMSFFAVFWIAGMSLKWGIGLVMGGIIGFSSLFLFMPHFVERINKFLDPANHDNYQVRRGLDAIASGGVFGRGAGEGVIKFLVPDIHTDYIFSMVGEEWGLLGALLLMFLFAVLIIHGVHKASKNPDPFAQVAGIGLFTLLGFQVAINLGVNVNLIPSKGMTLPFISYGGSSLLGSAITMGLALALTRRRPGANIMH